MKRFAAAAQRNQAPLLDALARLLPPRARVLEIGSGTGQHAAYFAAARPDWTWQPSDASEEALQSIEAYRLEAARPNLLPPIQLDARSPWPSLTVDAIVCINVIHISPWTVTEHLFRRSAETLAPGSRLVLYGPYRFHGEFLAPSNAAFSQRLQNEDPEWGVRDIDDLQHLATRSGFGPPSLIAMPANNHVLAFVRESEPAPPG